MKRKKIVLPFVCMFMMVLLSACGGKGEKTGDVPFAEVEKTNPDDTDKADVSVTENPKEDTGTEKGKSRLYGCDGVVCFCRLLYFKDDPVLYRKNRVEAFRAKESSCL